MRSLKRRAERYGVWKQVKVLMEIAAFAAALYATAAVLVVLRPAEWMAFTAFALALAAVLTWLLVVMGRITRANWEQAARAYEVSDQLPINPSFYDVA